MPTYTQSNRYVKVHTPLGDDALLLTKLRGHEALSQLFAFQLDLLAERAASVPFDRLLGQAATVELLPRGGEKRYVNGIVKGLRQGRQDDIFTHFHLELVPRFWLWSKRVRSRVFQQQTVPDILKTVLDGLDVSFSHLAGDYQPRNYCVQYRESDFTFASRLMEDEGIYYYFEHTANGHKMILADNSSHSPNLPHDSTLIFDQGEGGVRPEERIDRWDKSQELCSGKYGLWDHHFELPGQYLATDETIRARATAGKVPHSLQVGNNDQLEIFDYPGGFAHRFDGIDGMGGDQQAELQKVFEDNKRTVRLRMEEEAASSLWIDGGSTYRQMTPGYKFKLSRHFDGDGAYVLCRVEHEVDIHGDYATGQETTLEYRNRFRCLPLDLPFRPRRQTPRPRIRGPQTATVVGPSKESVGFSSHSNAAVGPSGDDIFCDRYGRVKVQFRWDREGQYSAASSCWLRVNQLWAGQQWGLMALPRVGQEVVVSFLEGDPDRPLILGSLYNAAQMPPFPLPAARTQAGIKAHSHGQGADARKFSGLGFETALGREHVHLHGERYMTQSAEQNLYVNAGQDHHVNVGRAASRQVGGLLGTNHTLTTGSPSSSEDEEPPSDGGGGEPSDGGEGESSDGGEGELRWNTRIAGALGHNLNMTFGWEQINAAGLSTETVIGQAVGSNFTPAGIVAAFGVPLPMAGAVTGILNVLGLPLVSLTAAEVKMGNALDFQFGSTLEVGSGHRLELNNSAETWKLKPATGVLALLYAGISITDAIVPAVLADKYKTELGDYVAMGAGIGALQVILSIWATVESVSALTETEEKLAEEAFTLAVYNEFHNNTGFATTTLGQLKTNLTNMNQDIAALTSAILKKCDASYTIEAPEIALRSAPPVAVPPAPQLPSQIKLSALGNAATRGEITIEAKDKTHISGGNGANLLLETPVPTVGNITLDCGAAGTLALQSGLLQNPNVMKMAPDGITTESMLRLMLKVLTNKIIIDPTGIQLQSGASSIYLTPDGILLTCGASSIQISPKGVAVSGVKVGLDGTLSVDIASLYTNISSKAITSVKGLGINIG